MELDQAFQKSMREIAQMKAELFVHASSGPSPEKRAVIAEGLAAVRKARRTCIENYRKLKAQLGD